MGDVDRAGDLLYRAALRVGFGPKTKVHGLGDGARWIDDQMKRVFSKQVKYLVDFYHTRGSAGILTKIAKSLIKSNAQRCKPLIINMKGIFICSDKNSFPLFLRI